MIYPGPGGSSGTRMRGTANRGNSSTSACVKGVRNGRRNGKGKPQQVVQWKQRNVQEGIVIVDEHQLSKLIKREPIQKFYELDPEPFAT
ncbi:hypothetical protein L9F63_026258 [Diploptera punctata]|uniref:Uncharacterized protein n=1 Tax=Diploptera punctata TaxID=6984 RepID=A0AAD8AKA2_DIPPU|nr:hypothetical protein L9F63_005993 [Diploptera punctata]KAJ9600604.1 hypothetical protein L9F63_026258 [Diploptera punctata]